MFAGPMEPTPPPSDAGKHANRDDAVAVVKRLRDAGHIAYFAGGCVRDTLLGLVPKDYDLATDAPPARVRQLFSNTQAVGAAFGVILVRHRKSVIEVATFRTDLQYKDGRRPEGVVFTTAEEDAKRRDFTINGLFMDPLEGDKVIDYVGGQEDLKSKVLRAIGEPNHRFEEDHLRLLRAVRFAARFDLEVDPGTAQAIAAHAQHLTRISPERVAEELRLMLTPPTRVDAWRILWDFQLLHVILRTLPERPSEAVPRGRYGIPLFAELEVRRPVPFALSLAAMVVCYRMAGWPKPTLPLLMAGEVRRSVQACRTTLKISNDEAESMYGILLLGPLMEANPPSVARMKRFLAQPTSSMARQLLLALATSHPEYRQRATWLETRLREFSRTDFAPPPLITGDDLTAAGLQPGPLFKRILDAVYDEQLEGHISSKEHALELARRFAKGE